MRGKRVREKGKVKLSQWFKTLGEGDRVTIVKDVSRNKGHPERMQGKTGTITGSRGEYKVVDARDGNSMKTFIIHPLHLKKLKA